jgi:oxygen-dependent protoporphyrinogen oxidase
VLDVIVVGAGITGLAAAYELERRNRSVRVLESSSRAGGVIVTERFDGWVLDGGPDALLVQKPAGVELCRELGLGSRLVSTLPPRTAYVLRGGRLHPLPEGSFLGLPVTARALVRSSLFTAAGKLRMACEPLVARRAAADDESIADFVRRRFGREAADYLADPLLAGIHAGDADRLSMQALFPRLVEAERRKGSVIRAFRALGTPRAADGAFVSLPGGIGELVEALTAAIGSGTLALGATVTSVLRSAGAYEVEANGATIRSRAVILAVPAYAAAQILAPLDPPLAALCGAVPYASTATVAFGFRRAQVRHPLAGTGFVVPRLEGRTLLAATWVTSKWPHRAPEGHVLLRAFLGGGRDPLRLESSDTDLVATALDQLTAALDIEGAPLFSRLFRWTRQSPQYEVGHLARVAAIEQGLAAFPGLFLAGSGFRAIGIPDCIADGRTTAARAAAFVGGSLQESKG